MARWSLVTVLLATLLLTGCSFWSDDHASYEEGTPLERFQAADGDVSFDLAMPTDTAGFELVSLESGEGEPDTETVWAVYEAPDDSSRTVEFAQAEIGFREIPGIEDATPVTVPGTIGRLIHDSDGTIRLYWTTTAGYLVEGSGVGEDTVLQIARSVTPLDALVEQEPTPTVAESDVIAEIERELEGIQGQVDFPLVLPAHVPAGYARVSVLSAGARVIIELRPGDVAANNVITMTQARGATGTRPEPDETSEITVRDQSATLERARLRQGGTLVTIAWAEGDLSYEVGGIDVPEEELRNIAESLRPLDATR